MKLDKVETKHKRVSKKTMIIGTSTIAIMTFCGITGWALVKNNKNRIVEFAQNVISGQSTKEATAVGENLDTGMASKEEIDKVVGKMDKENIEQLERYLRKAGFGYSTENVEPYRKSVEEIEKYDKGNKIAPAEKIYMLYFGEKEKPKYGEFPGVEPKISFESYPPDIPKEIDYSYVEAKYTYNGKTVSSGKVYCVVGTEETGKRHATEKIQGQYYLDHEDWKKNQLIYDKWKEYSNKRDQRLSLWKGLYFREQDVDKTFDGYTYFYARLARAALKLSDSPSNALDENGMKDLIDTLYKQIWDDDGNEREDKNVLNKYLSGEKYDVYEGPSSSGGGNGNTSGGGSSGGGSSSGGGDTSGGGSSGGGDTSGGSSSGDSSEQQPPEELEDKVAPSIVRASVTSPVTGIYNKGQEVKIKVEFDKKVYGEAKKVDINKNTAPKLMIRWGEGENKLATFDSVSGRAIMYTYIIDKADQGKLQIGKNDNYIGSVYNESGYKAQLKSISKLEEDNVIEADNMAPTVEKMEVISEAGEYKTDSEIEIKVTFNEKIYTDRNKIPLINETAPILNISFGEGEVRNPVVAEINNEEMYIIYKYKITNEDRGSLKIDAKNAFDGSKTICDEFGNEVKPTEGKELTGNQITANLNLSQITLDKQEITLDLKGTKTAVITATVTPNTTALSWESSDEEVATIEGETGTITALAVGETMITVTAEDGAEATCKVVVKDTTTGETKIQLNQNTLELDLNKTKTAQLTATVTPTPLAIDWSSTDEEIVTVNENGQVTAIKKGEATIIAKAKDGTTATCEVKVINSNANAIEPTRIDLNLQNVKVVSGKTKEIQLKTRVTPSNSNTNQQIQYESSDETVASVDEKGKVTIKGKGVAVITATSGNGQTSYCAIEVAEVTEDSEIKDKVLGDINQDNKVDTTDLLAMLRHIATSSSSQIAQKHQDWILSEDKYVLADVNSNGIVDVTDTLKLLRHIAAAKSEIIREKHQDWMIITNWK